MMFLDQRNGIRMKKISLILLVILVLSSGCNPFKRYVYVHDRYPVYDVPERTELPKISANQLECLDEEVRKSIIESVKNLKSDQEKLRAILKSYNEYAKRKNSEYDKIFK